MAFREFNSASCSAILHYEEEDLSGTQNSPDISAVAVFVCLSAWSGWFFMAKQTATISEKQGNGHA